MAESRIATPGRQTPEIAGKELHRLAVILGGMVNQYGQPDWALDEFLGNLSDISEQLSTLGNALAAFSARSATASPRLYTEEQVREACEKVVGGLLAKLPQSVPSATLPTRDEIIEECAQQAEKYGRYEDPASAIRALKSHATDRTEDK